MEWIRLHKESVTGRDGYSDFYKKEITFNLLTQLVIKLRNGYLKKHSSLISFGDLSMDEHNSP